MEEVIELSSGDEAAEPQAEGVIQIEGYVIGYEERRILEHRSAWFNDEIINAYLRILSKEHPANYYFNSFFYTTIQSRGIRSVQRWARRVDMASKKRVFVPVNLNGSHWVLVMVEPGAKRMTFYDSLLGRHQGLPVMQSMAPFFFTEWAQPPVGLLAFLMAKTNISGATPSVTFVLAKAIPRQQDGSSCGAFVCKFAEYLSQGRALDFVQRDVDRFRDSLLDIFKANKSV